jgi:hypothetical protein
MPRELLVTASEGLEAAADDTTEPAASERLADLAEQLSTLSTADRGPDHGRLARIQSALNDLKTGDAADASDDIEAANDAINEYRSDLAGV